MALSETSDPTRTDLVFKVVEILFCFVESTFIRSKQSLTRNNLMLPLGGALSPLLSMFYINL